MGSIIAYAFQIFKHLPYANPKIADASFIGLDSTPVRKTPMRSTHAARVMCWRPAAPVCRCTSWPHRAWFFYTFSLWMRVPTCRPTLHVLFRMSFAHLLLYVHNTQRHYDNAMFYWYFSHFFTTKIESVFIRQNYAWLTGTAIYFPAMKNIQ